MTWRKVLLTSLYALEFPSFLQRKAFKIQSKVHSMDKDSKRNKKSTPSEDVNLNVSSGTVIRNLHVPCNDSKLNEHFSENIIALVFHKEISVVNLIYILHRCSSLENIHLDNVKLIYPDNEKKGTKLRSDKIILKHLKQIKISITLQSEGISNSSPASLHPDTLRLFKFIEMITFGSLEEIDIICSLAQLLTIPLPAAFVPNYIIQKPDSLVEFLYSNRCTLRQLTIGPAENQKLFIAFQIPDQSNTEPVDHNFHKMAEFVNREPTEFEILVTAHDHPLPQWWMSILEHQTTLKHLSLTLMDTDVLTMALAAAEKCCDTITVLHLRITGKDMYINLRKLNRCVKITTMSLTVHECYVHVSNFDLLPESIKIFKVSGCLCEKHCDALVKSLFNIQELTVCLNKFDYPETTVFSIVNWPVFENILDFRHLEFFVVEAEHLTLDWDEIHEWSKTIEWCRKITRNTLEEIEREEIQMHISPIGLQPTVESDTDVTVLGSLCSYCFGTPSS